MSDQEARVLDFKYWARAPFRWFSLRWLGLTHAGKAVYVHPSVRVRTPDRIALADEVHVLWRSELVCDVNGSIALGFHTRIDHDVTLQAGNGYIKMGSYGYVGPYSILRGDGGLEIGDDVLISPQVVIMSVNHEYRERSRRIRDQGETCRGIQIEADVWIGSGAKIMDGVIIRQGAVIGAGAVVTHDVPPFVLAAGVPARIVGERR